MTLQQRLEQIFFAAQNLHQTGHFREAEAGYRQAISLDARHVNSLQMLAILLQQTERADEALHCIRAAVSAAPGDPNVQFNLGSILRERGDYPGAISAFRAATGINPNFVAAHLSLAQSLRQAGHFPEAYASARKASELAPNDADAMNELGGALTQLRRFEEAADVFRRTLKLRPDFVEAQNNLGGILQQSGKAAEALPIIQNVLAQRRDFPDAWLNLGNALCSLCRFPEAAAAFQQVINSQPNSPEAWGNLSIARLAAGDVDQAIAAARRVVSLMPVSAISYQNLGHVLKKADYLDEAAEAYQRCIQLDPKNGQAVASLGNCMADLGLIEQAVPLLRRATELTDVPWPAGSLSYTLYFDPSASPETILKACQYWNARYVRPLVARPAFRNLPDPDRRLRIGYVSPYFRSHVHAHYTVPLFTNHDSAQVEIYCYSTATQKDTITDQLRSRANVWYEVEHLSDKELADLIRRDQIDIAVDLTMHLDRGRLFTFAERIAPVQVCWLAYPGTTGLAEMDYRISDPIIDPAGNDVLSTEKTIRLPDSLWIYDPLIDEPAVNDLPALSNEYITFGSTNNFIKVNESTLLVWEQVLKAVPNSRLAIIAPEGRTHARLRAHFEHAGIDASRLDLLDRRWRPRADYLRLHHRFDLIIDTFPYNGHTTTLDSLWMGVPPLTAPGETSVSRAGLMILSNLGLADFAAKDLASLTQAAQRIASDLPRLANLRATLRERLIQSPLMNAPRFARNMEAAYRTMWRSWCEARG